MDRTSKLLAAVACLGACATSTAPTRVGESTWMLTGTDAWALSSENAVVERLTAQAQAHCGHVGGSLELMDVASSKPYGRPAQGRITFECVREEADGEPATAAETAPADGRQAEAP